LQALSRCRFFLLF